MHSRTRLGLIVLAAATYEGLCYWLTALYPAAVLSQATVLGPMCAVAVFGLWSDGQRRWAVLLVLALGLLLSLCASAMLAVQWLYLAQHAGVHLGLGWWFGRTLLAGRQPLISMLATRVHGPLEPEMARYTRDVTRVWTSYFLATAVISLLLFLGAPLPAWSLLANVLTPVALVLLFVGEYVWRYRRHPDFERVPLMEAVRAYRASATTGRADAHGGAHDVCGSAP